MKRQVIYASDVQSITGKSRSYAYRELKMIREKLNKNKNQDITRREYCTFKGLDYNDTNEGLGQ